jgi:hypothetical protein
MRYRTIPQEYEVHLLSKAKSELAIRPHGFDEDYEVITGEEYTEFLKHHEEVPEAAPRGRDFRKEVKVPVTRRRRRTKAEIAADKLASLGNGHQTPPAETSDLLGETARV